MNRNFIFFFILLATFSVINAIPHQLRKRATKFNPCPVEGVDPLTVGLSPDPPVSEQSETFTISGTLGHDITAGKTIVAIGYADTSKNPIGKIFTKAFDQSFKAGSPFSVTENDVPTPKLPSAYFIGVVVGDPTDDPNNPFIAYGCAFAVVGAGEASIDGYPIASILSYPIAERSYPIAERSYPIAERSYPIAERSYPIAERSYPIAERSYPIAERS